MTWDYAPAPESRAIVDIHSSYGLFIDGAFVEATGGSAYKTENPATEEVLADVAAASPADVDRAVEAAGRAQKAVWGPMPGAERAKYLYRIARMIQERSRELAVLESLDNGKPIRESRDVDVPLAAAHFFYYAGWADKLDYAGFGPDPRPIGVAGQVIPWNFPLMMAAWKLAPALAAGNTCVLKPATTTPLSALLLAEIIQQADLPPGVVNVLTGAGSVAGAALVAHPGVDKVAFTGSTEIGKDLQRALAGTGKHLTLELGGKAANIVFDDAPVDQAVEGIVNGIFFNQGEVCCAGSRLLVQESIADVVVEKLKHRLGTLRVGDPLDKNTDLGAINNAAQLEKIRSLVAEGEAEGAVRWSPECDLPAQGYWFPPTVFTGVSQAHRIAQEEIFGPVLSVLTFRTPEEAVAKANNTVYGLSAGVWTEKGSRILWMAGQLRAGVVWANSFNRFDPSSPFGGYRESGFGREGGRQGLAAYLDV
ncbi:MAG: aldehyde dehydrogenase family protein [Acidimicrobiales bacterium]|jgi:aldehyde dehydrogenase (NAD+)